MPYPIQSESDTHRIHRRNMLLTQKHLKNKQFAPAETNEFLRYLSVKRINHKILDRASGTRVVQQQTRQFSHENGHGIDTISQHLQSHFSAKS